MPARIPLSDLPTIVIVGAGFAGLRLARKLSNKPYQVVVIDKRNFHQFQPLMYQVATAGIAPSAIAFPIRKLFHHAANVHFRMAELKRVDLASSTIETTIGPIPYNHLVIAVGADTNYFGNEAIAQNAFPMKSIEESLQLRNRILQCMERALVTENDAERRALMNIVIVGGGPTGVELAGALAEMKSYVLPDDYPELDFSHMQITLVEAGPNLLGTMSAGASKTSANFLNKMGVTLMTDSQVTHYDGTRVDIEGHDSKSTKTLIWAAGIKGNPVPGLPDSVINRNGRISVNEYNGVDTTTNVYAIGDIAQMTTNDLPRGHPQVAQVAIQQATNLAHNFIAKSRGKAQRPFAYRDLGSMATVGRSKAVADLPFWHLGGFFAWLIWLFVHLMSILGVKNKFFTFIDWMWYYLTFDQSLRLVITHQRPAADNDLAPDGVERVS